MSRDQYWFFISFLYFLPFKEKNQLSSFTPPLFLSSFCPMPQLKLAKLKGKPEIFYTLQGEGTSMGVPSVFIRSSLCNLHCSWCDTDYTWNWVNTPWRHENESLEGYKKFEKKDYIVKLDAESIADAIISHECHNVIITGGEPLLQQEAWVELMEELRRRDPKFRFEVETNGTIVPQDSFAKYIDQFNVSPKLNNSGNSAQARLKKDALEYFKNCGNSWFKFVITDEVDLTEIESIIDNFAISKQKIILMPEGRTRRALNLKRTWLAEICKRDGYRFGDRLHIRLWGGKRGV